MAKPKRIQEVDASPITSELSAKHPTGKVLAIHGLESLVEVEGGIRRCTLSGRLKHQREDLVVPRQPGSWERDTRQLRGRWERGREHSPTSSPIAVGDDVVVHLNADGTGRIVERHPRRCWLGRMRPSKGPQVIAANVEIALVVMAVAKPDPSLFLLDQFLVQAETGGMDPWVLLNKADLLRPPATCETYEAAQIYRRAGYAVHCLSATEGIGITDLYEALRNRAAVMVGPSGAGKSSLLNRLAPTVDARIGEISEWSGRGQHTTTHVAMYLLPGGGYLVDAPGIRSLALWQVLPANLAGYFREFQPFVANCGFPGCTHTTEGDCAVRLAAEEGTISGERYEHYLEMHG